MKVNPILFSTASALLSDGAFAILAKEKANEFSEDLLANSSY